MGLLKKHYRDLAAGSDETLLDDSRQLLNKLLAADNEAQLIIYPEQKHNWPLANIHSNASQQLLRDVRNFLKA